jgi:hypothetical protein
MIRRTPCGRGGREENRGWGLVLLEVFLHDEAAHGMSDEHGLGTQFVRGSACIVSVIGDGTRVQRLEQGAGTAAAQALKFVQSAVSMAPRSSGGTATM